MTGAISSAEVTVYCPVCGEQVRGLLDLLSVTPYLSTLRVTFAAMDALHSCARRGGQVTPKTTVPTTAPTTVPQDTV